MDTNANSASTSATPTSADANLPAWMRDSLELKGQGKRASFHKDAMPAQRQALQRAEAADFGDGREPSLGDWKVLTRVLALTTSYSRLADEATLAQLTPTGMSVDTTRRALKKWHRAGVIFYRPGNGRGKPSVVGVPPVAKGSHLDATLSAAKGSQMDATLSPAKGLHGDTEKGCTHTRAHARAVPCLLSEEKNYTEESAAAARAQEGKNDLEWESFLADFTDACQGQRLRGPGLKIVKDEWHRDRQRVEAFALDALERADNPAALLVTILKDGDEYEPTARLSPEPRPRRGRGPAFGTRLSDERLRATIDALRAKAGDDAGAAVGDEADSFDGLIHSVFAETRSMDDPAGSFAEARRRKTHPYGPTTVDLADRARELEAREETDGLAEIVDIEDAEIVEDVPDAESAEACEPESEPDAKPEPEYIDRAELAALFAGRAASLSDETTEAA